MKLLIYTPQFLPQVGGLQYVAAAWAEQWSKMGNTVTVICHAPKNEKDNYNYRVLRHPSFKATLWEMRRHDVVIMFNVSLKALPQWLLSGKPLIISHHSGLYIPGAWKQNLIQYLKKGVAEKLARANIACSAFTAAAYKHCHVVYSPFKSYLFKNYNNPARKQAIVFAGRLVSDKGCDLLIKAAAISRKLGQPFPDITIIGNGPEMTSLQQLGVSSGVNDLLKFKGFIEGAALVDELNKHSIMIIPSRLEPFGIVALEGLACGCSIIVSDTGGLPEAAGGFGRSFASENVQQLAEAIQQALTEKKSASNGQVEDHLQIFTESATAMRAFEIIENAVKRKNN